MIKIFKLIVIVAIAVLVGIWANKYHGYIMVVLDYTSVKMNLVAFVFALVILIFLVRLGFRVIKLLFSIPSRLFRMFRGLVETNKKHKFTDLVASISLNDNEIVDRLTITQIRKIVPNDFQEYIIFRKLMLMVEKKNINKLQSEIKQLNNKEFIYKFFSVYMLYLQEKLLPSLESVKKLLVETHDEFKAEAIKLATKITLDCGSGDFALEILEKHSKHLSLIDEEPLVILAMQTTKNVRVLSSLYEKSDTTKELTKVYIEQLLKLEDLSTAQRIIKKQLNSGNIDSNTMYICINSFNFDIKRLYTKVCNNANKNNASILSLLDIAMINSDLDYFKKIYYYIEANIKNHLSQAESEKYNHILCKFYIKNGNIMGINLSEDNLTYTKK